MNPHEEEDLIGSDVNPFHQRIPQGYCRQRRQVDQGENLYLKVDILEYHGSLCGDDFIEGIEAIKRVFEYRVIPNDRLQDQALAQ